MGSSCPGPRCTFVNNSPVPPPLKFPLIFIYVDSPIKTQPQGWLPGCGPSGGRAGGLVLGRGVGARLHTGSWPSPSPTQEVSPLPPRLCPCQPDCHHVSPTGTQGWPWGQRPTLAGGPSRDLEEGGSAGRRGATPTACPNRPTMSLGDAPEARMPCRGKSCSRRPRAPQSLASFPPHPPSLRVNLPTGESEVPGGGGLESGSTQAGRRWTSHWSL